MAQQSQFQYKLVTMTYCNEAGDYPVPNVVNSRDPTRLYGRIAVHSTFGKANTACTEAPILDLHLYITNGFVISKIYVKHDEFDFDIIVKFPYLDGDVLHLVFFMVRTFYVDLVYKCKKLIRMNH